ncbi:hypothetical protein Tco_1080253 [Tanacetum coccineum]|uniref:Uncharacterized protein n=1 Tax=Tanacetum coccineum TaxID=301880 RepID=A0ABQ5HU68_9ASTR
MPRTPQQKWVAKRMNMTLIEAARTMLADSLYQLPLGRSNKPNVKGVGYRWMFDIDYLTDSMNYIPVSLENQANPYAKEEILTEPQQEKEASSTDTSEDNPKILAFRRELEEIALKHLGTVSENNSTSTPLVNSGSEPVNTGDLERYQTLLPAMLSIANPSVGQEAPSVTQPQPSSKAAQGNQTDLWEGTLAERVKSLEVALKRKTKRVLLSDSEEEETKAQGRKTHNLDPLSPTTLEAAAILTKVKSAFEEVNTGGIKVSAGIEEINACSLDVNTSSDPVTTDSIRVSVPSPDRGRREGKAPMTEEEETQASKRTNSHEFLQER